MLARLVVVGFCMVLLVGCIPSTFVTGSGNTVTREFDFRDFTQLNVSNAFTVDVREGDGYSIAVTVDDNLEKYLKIDKIGDEVSITLDQRFALGLNRVTLRADVTMPALERLTLSGATRGDVTGFEGDDSFEARVSGASVLRGKVVRREVRLEASGASSFNLKGEAEEMNLTVSGASTAKMGDFSAKDAEVRASGASKATVMVSGKLTGDASGASTIEYVNEPQTVRVDSSGASTVRGRH